MKRRDPSAKDCPRASDIPAYLQGELGEPNRAAMAGHLAACPACAAECAAMKAVLQNLRSFPPEPPGRDMSADVLARIRQDRRPAGHDLRWLKWAAGLAILLGAGLFLARQRDTPPAAVASAQETAVREGLAWLAEAQEADGHWDAARWNAQKQYTPGITALAVLALLDRAAADPSAAAARGIDYLLSFQAQDGRFGALASGTPYNTALAAMAVLEADAREADPRRRAAAERALAYIRGTQQENGGWGYPRSAPNDANTSITVWQILVLMRAESLGYDGCRPAVERGLAWLRGTVDEDGRMGYSRAADFRYGYETLTAAGTLCAAKAGASNLPREQMADALREVARRAADDPDYYRTFFLASALRASGAPRLAEPLCEALVARQVKTGPSAGAWEADDRWSSAGGRVYATAMAVLTLQEAFD